MEEDTPPREIVEGPEGLNPRLDSSSLAPAMSFFAPSRSDATSSASSSSSDTDVGGGGP